MLARYFLDEIDRRRRAAGLGPLAPLPAEALDAFARHDWPGNVRELKNVVERWAVLGEGVPDQMAEAPAAVTGDALLALPFHEARERHTEAFERQYLEALLARTRGNVSAAAREAGMDRRQMQRLLLRHGLRGDGTAGAAGEPQG